MERRTLPGRLSWQRGEVVATQTETARTKSITLAVPHWMGHRAGQHVDVRLTAEDGYQVERSYSIASMTGKSHPTSPRNCALVTSLNCAAPSVATSSGRRRWVGRSCSSPGGQ